jgi:hypothetical protein
MQFFSTSCAKITCAPTPFLCITVNTTAASPSRYTFGQYSDSTCKHTACIEAAFLPVNEGYRFLILSTSLLVTLYSTRSHHASSPSRRFPALTLPSRTPPRPLSPRLFSSQLSIGADVPLNYCPQRLYAPFSFMSPGTHLVPLVPRPGTVTDTNGPVSLGGCRL